MSPKVVIKCKYCSRDKGKENPTNWNRHVESCKRKFESSVPSKVPKHSASIAKKITAFFSAPTKEDTGNGENKGIGEPNTSNSQIEVPVPTEQTVEVEADCEETEKNLSVKENEDGDGGKESPVDSFLISGLEESDNGDPSAKGIVEPNTSNSQIEVPVPTEQTVEVEAEETEKNLLVKENEDGDSGKGGPVDPFSISGLNESDNGDPSAKDVLDFEASTADLTFKNDPARFCKISMTKDVTRYFKNLGPCQPTAEELPSKMFPEDRHKRHFHSAYYFKKLPDGSHVKRDWISYSPSENKVYCTDCIIYGKGLGTDKAWTTTGFNTWKNISQRVLLHEISGPHIQASIKAKMEESCVPLVASLEEGRRKNVLMNREIVKHLIDCLLYLAKHCMAFRGHREFDNFDFHGNFVDLLQLIAKYSPPMDMYLTSLLNKEVKNSLLYWRRQNQLLETIANRIKKVIVREIQEAPFFSVSMDGSFDFSHKEQLCFVVRYISGQTCQVVERLLSIKQCTEGSGKHIFEMFKEICFEQGLDWRQYMVGQSHDGAANMRGEEQGVQARVREENSCAIYVWCNGHRLALVVKDIADCCLNAKNLFSYLEAGFKMVCGSKIRADYYEKQQKTHYPKNRVRRLKRVLTTRWLSQEKALNVELETHAAFVNTLEFVATSEETDSKARKEAEGLLSYFRSETFFLTAFMFKKIFAILEPLNRVFQSVDVDLISAVEILRSKQAEIASLRSEGSLEGIKSDCKDFLEKNGIEEMTPLPTTRSRKRKLMSGEMAEDQPQTDPYEDFKVNTYLTSLDMVSTRMKERFEDSNMELLKDLALFTESRIEEIRKSPASLPSDAFISFAGTYSKFVNLESLVKEYKLFVQCYAEFANAMSLPEILHPDLRKRSEDEDLLGSSGEGEVASGEDENVEEVNFDEEEEILGNPAEAPKKVLHTNSICRVYKVFCKKGLESIFPTLFVALKIAVTIPVASSSNERSFSKMKIIKNRLRTSTSGDRLDALMQIACEPDIEIDYEAIINDFAALSPLLTKMLIV